MHHYLFTATNDQRNENLDPMFYVQYPLLKTSGITALKILIRCVIHKTPSKDGVNKTPYSLYSIHVPLFNFLNDVTGQVCPAPMLPKKSKIKQIYYSTFWAPFRVPSAALPRRTTHSLSRGALRHAPSVPPRHVLGSLTRRACPTRVLCKLPGTSG